ncbi:MAG: hypothetical protein JWQ40_2290 [Segetibacter sp.]|nr:hypothetical protein [Segetibacter sp.]
MKEILHQHALYNLWANRRIVDVILPLSGELHFRHVASSFSSLQLTLLHLWNTDHIWMQRLNRAETIPLGNEQSTMTEIAAGLIERSRLWGDWVEKSTNESLEKVFSYQNFKKEPFTQPLFQILLHVFNHATYHRGQLVTILRQLGVDNIPATDFIVWSRAKK